MDVQQRAVLSAGASARPIHEMVRRTVDQVGDSLGGGPLTVVDCGCGRGDLRPYLAQQSGRYIGVDVLRYPEFPADAEFVQADGDGSIPLADGVADLALAVETIEHVENPRAFLREIHRLVRPGGWVIVTTPNVLSLLSLASLAVSGRFAAFSDRDYPAHISPVLEVDLRRMADELGLDEVQVDFSRSGRIPLTARHYPRLLPMLMPRRCSDNLLIRGRKS